ncbi:MAG: hypothetical protein IJW30_06000 [Clostridia bacterium]|nr:hypothetical protein [Clostridia bacterium]MBQ9774200.1 hypothetical protein [Clostridia bacterium]
MSISAFIPTVWSETLYTELDKQYIGVSHCNRDFEGDIRECGNTVKICGLNPISVHDYAKNTDMSLPEELTSFNRELVIDQAKYFNFLIDDVERAQSNPDAMQLAMKNAANALADAADKYVYKICSESGSVYEADVTVDNILNCLIEARTRMFENNVSETEEIFLEVSPSVAELIFKAKINLSTDNTDLVDNGCIGSIFGYKVYVSKNIATEGSDIGDYVYCIMRTKRAVTFAEQLSEIDAYRPELRFADAIKGLHLYGAKVVYPNELLRLKFNVNYQEA